ncbi:hypothetical protein DFH28DRAFT_976237 [Melampsora americana]|nr:hypothetical protein DFH28DRAFT_976237 [Melampsora americana]
MCHLIPRCSRTKYLILYLSSIAIFISMNQISSMKKLEGHIPDFKPPLTHDPSNKPVEFLGPSNTWVDSGSPDSKEINLLDSMKYIKEQGLKSKKSIPKVQSPILHKKFKYPILSIAEASPPFNVNGKSHIDGTLKNVFQTLWRPWKDYQCTIYEERIKLLLDKFGSVCMNLKEIVEIYRNYDSGTRARLTKYILASMNRYLWDRDQIDKVLNMFREVQAELSLYDKAHLSFSLHSFGKHQQSVHEDVIHQIVQFATSLEQDCRSDPNSLRIIWSGENLEEEQVIRDLLDPMLSLTQANFDEVLKFSSWRAPWAHQIITSNGIHNSSKELFGAPPEDIRIKMRQALSALQGNTPGSHQLTSWDYMYLIKTLYIYQTSFETNFKHFLTPEQGNTMSDLIDECKQFFRFSPLFAAPHKVLEMKRAYGDILDATIYKDELTGCPYQWDVWLRIAEHHQLAPANEPHKDFSNFLQSISEIRDPSLLIQKIQEIGKIGSEIPSFSNINESRFYHNQILKLLQFLFMKYYVNDDLDFLVKETIIRKAIEAGKKVNLSRTKEIALALIGRCAALYPKKKEILNLAQW